MSWAITPRTEEVRVITEKADQIYKECKQSSLFEDNRKVVKIPLVTTEKPSTFVGEDWDTYWSIAVDQLTKDECKQLRAVWDAAATGEPSRAIN